MALARLDIHSAPVPVLCRASQARHGGICSVLEPIQLLHLGRHARRQEVPPETELIAFGERPRRHANILGGVVKLMKIMPDGRQQIVGLQFAPDFLGRPFADRSEVSAVAASTVRICSFPREMLDEMARVSPDLVRRLHEQALRELDEARDWMLTLGRKTAAEKVASFLLFVAAHADPEGGAPATEFEIPLDRASIADFLGLTVETVSRQLTLLRKAGVIAIEKQRQVTITNPRALAAARS